MAFLILYKRPDDGSVSLPEKQSQYSCHNYTLRLVFFRRCHQVKQSMREKIAAMMMNVSYPRVPQ